MLSWYNEIMSEYTDHVKTCKICGQDQKLQVCTEGGKLYDQAIETLKQARKWTTKS